MAKARTRRRGPQQVRRGPRGATWSIVALSAMACGSGDLESRKAAALEAQALGYDDQVQPWRPLTEPEKIEKLLEVVRESGMTFIRNGREMSAREAATRLQRRYERQGRKVATARDFAGRFGASGPLSGKPYLVRLPDGREIFAREWMLEQLDEIEAPPGRYVDRLGDPLADAPRTGPKVALEAQGPPTIESALDHIEASELTFAAPQEGERPVLYSGREFAKMLRNKGSWIGADITEVQPWIDGIATRSFKSYTVYQVHHPDGNKEPVPQWLRRELELPTPEPAPATAESEVPSQPYEAAP